MNGSLYYISKKPNNSWFYADSLCLALGGRLVDIGDQDENIYVGGMTDEIFWI